MTDDQKKRLSMAHRGQIAWNKGMKGYLEGEKHWKWQKEKPSYRAVHAWMSKIYGKPIGCDLCGRLDAKRFEWANKSGEYKRDFLDWLRLCKSCHNIYDNTGYKAWETRRRQIL